MGGSSLDAGDLPFLDAYQPAGILLSRSDFEQVQTCRAGFFASKTSLRMTRSERRSSSPGAFCRPLRALQQAVLDFHLAVAAVGQAGIVRHDHQRLLVLADQ